MIVQSRIYVLNIGKFYTYPYLFAEVLHIFNQSQITIYLFETNTNKYVKSQLI